MNDHNRAPASIGVPADENTETDQKKVIDQQARADFLFLQADLESLDGRSQSSIESLKSAITIDPDSSVLMQRLAVEYYRRGQLQDSLYWAQKALDKSPDKRDLILFVAGLLTSKKQFDKAETLYKKLIKVDKEDAEGHLYLAAVYSEKKDYAKANEYFTRLLTFKSYESKHIGYYYRARSAMESGNKKLMPQVRSDLQKSLDHKPDYFEALQLLGQIMEKAEGRDAVFKFYAQHQKKKGPYARLAEVLSQYYIDKDDYDKAYEQLEILEWNSDDQVAVKLKMALILIDKKMYSMAESKLEELSVLVPESDKVKFYLGAVYEEQKKLDKAIDVYLQIPKSSGHFEDARIHASFLLKSQGYSDRGLAVIKESLTVKSENIQSYFLTSQFYEEKKQYDLAVQTLTKAADGKFANNAQLHYFMGTLYDRMNEKDKMFTSMRKVLALDEENVQALNYVAYSLAELNLDMDEAETMATKAYKLQNDDAFIIDTLGWIHYKRGHFKKAVELLEKAHNLSPEVSVIAEHLGDAYTKLNNTQKAKDVYLKAIDSETDSDKKRQIEFKVSELEKRQNGRQPASVPSDASLREQQ